MKKFLKKNGFVILFSIYIITGIIWMGKEVGKEVTALCSLLTLFIVIGYYIGKGKSREEINYKYDILKENYGELKDEHEHLDKEFGELEKKYNNLGYKYDELEASHSQLEDNYEELEVRHDILAEEKTKK